MKTQHFSPSPAPAAPLRCWPSGTAFTLTALLGLAATASASAAPVYSFREITIPQAEWTRVNGLNNAGDLVGQYYDGTALHGFLLREGELQEIRVPNMRITVPLGVNDSGSVVGRALDTRNTPLPFLREPDGGAWIVNQNHGDAVGINNAGKIVGSELDAGIILTPGETSYTKRYFSYSLEGDTLTYLTGINARDAYTGSLVVFDDPDLNTYYSFAFVVDEGGPRILPIPGLYPEATGINESGIVCGNYYQTNSNPAAPNGNLLRHGFIYRDEQLVTVDIPGSHDWPLTMTFDEPGVGMVTLPQTSAGTLILGLNDRGQIVAQSGASYANEDFSFYHDFVRSYLGTLRPAINSFGRLAGGQFLLEFDAAPGGAYTVVASVNLTDWTSLGPATETAPGHFEFADLDAPKQATRFYQLRSP